MFTLNACVESSVCWKLSFMYIKICIYKYVYKYIQKWDHDSFPFILVGSLLC